MNAPVRIDQLASEHQVVPFLSTDEYQHSAGSQALDDMRQMIGRSGPASRWSRLSLSARQMICYAAHLRPSTYASMELDELTVPEREAIRRAISAMREINTTFGEQLLDRCEWLLIPCRETARTSEAAQQKEAVRRALLSKQARQLQARVEKLKAAKAASTENQ